MSNTCFICFETGDAGFFLVPKNENRRKSWLNSLHLSDRTDLYKKNLKLCFRHFEIKDLKQNDKRYSLYKGKN